MVRDKVLGIRLDTALIARLDELAAHLSRKADGAEVSRSDAFRIAATRGLDAYAAEIAAAIADLSAELVGIAPADERPDAQRITAEGETRRPSKAPQSTVK